MADLWHKIEWGTMLYQLLIFIVLLILLRIFAFKPLVGIMHKRQQYVEDQIQSAENDRQEAQTLLEEQRKVLQQAREEAQQLIERAKQQSQTEAEEIRKTAQANADRLLADARKEIEREKEKAVAELRDQVGTLSVMLASKIVDKELKEEDQEKDIQQFMQQVGDRL